jgi:O-antigen/teichoic acid export membrane protein
LPVGTIGFYNVAYSITARGALLAGAVGQAILPHLAAIKATDDRARLRAQFLKFQALIALGTVPAFAALVFAATPVLTFTFNAEIATNLLLPIVCLSAGFYLSGILTAPYVLALAAGRADIFMRSNLLALIAVVPVTALLIGAFGLVGAGSSWLYYNAFMLAYTAPRVCREIVGMSVTDWLSPVSRLALVGLLPYLAAGTAAGLAGGATGALITSYIGGSIGWAVLGYLSAGDDLKTAISAIVKPTVVEARAHVG